MSFLELDFISVVIGYAVGIALMWSIHTVLFEEELDDATTKRHDEAVRNSPYTWNFPYDTAASD